MEKVIFDTNFLLEKRMKNFFGKQEELKKFASIAEIIIPDMVMGELTERYRRDFKTEKTKFIKTLLNNIVSHDIDTVDIEKSIEDLINSETVSYEVIALTDTSYLFQMKELALKKEPPFESKDGTDKGFKDAYIYFTVLEYLQNIDDKYIFFVTDDVFLTKAFEKHSNVYVVKNHEEFKIKSIGELFDTYFISKLQAEIDVNITSSSMIDYWISAKENQVLVVEANDIQYIIEVDAGEIVNFKEVYDYREEIDSLTSSSHYSDTLDLIKCLKKFITFFTEENIIKLLTALVENSQIRGTVGAGDYTIDFMGEIYEIAGDKLPVEIQEKIPERIRKWGL